ncbi:sugar dehydrogenase complex small subunit [Erwinia sp. LJJL01]|uniref:sugar dehydrogenase complex small subunit n=1 Tax=Erwinia sp. LJJL01 TaxID=3391839 RepID=UPI00105BF0A0
MLTRRTLITSGAALLGMAVLNPSLSWGAAPAASSDSHIFYRISLLLTGRTQLSPLVSERALHCLAAEDAQFPAHLQQLSSALQSAGITQADQLNGHALMQGGSGDTIKTIISAWYLGYTGTPVALRAVDNTRFVTYTDALMYAPTLDATVIPTYSRGHTNYWTQPPATLKND